MPRAYNRSVIAASAWRNADSDAARFAERWIIALEGGCGAGLGADDAGPGPWRSGSGLRAAGRNGLARMDRTRPKQLRIGRKMALGCGHRVRWE